MRCGVVECTVALDEDGVLRCDYCGGDYCEAHATYSAHDLVKCVYCQQDGGGTDDDLVLEARQR